MKRIELIAVEKVKGIQKLEIKDHLVPNKPNIFVAPNGFGKSSLASAFGSLNRNGIRLSEDTFYQNDETNNPRLTITVVNSDNSRSNYSADKNHNTISSEIGIFVINSQLVSKHTQKNIPGVPRSVVNSHIEVSPIILVDKIPERVSFGYSPSKAKQDFGKNGKILPNMEPLLGNHRFVVEVLENIDFQKLEGKRKKKNIEYFKEQSNQMSGSKSDILREIETNWLDFLSAVEQLAQIVEISQKHHKEIQTVAEHYLIAIEFAELCLSNKQVSKKVKEYYSYLLKKNELEQSFSYFNATWKEIKPIAEKGSLVVRFPKANQVSNGERDAICFLASLLKAETKLDKSINILIIDEVFDYLDDANLIAAQYFISKFVAGFKERGKFIIPIILTHLNPHYFRNFRFQKVNIIHLDKFRYKENRSLEKIIINRKAPSVKDSLSKHFLHFSNEIVDLTTEFNDLGLDSAYANSGDFRRLVTEELISYQRGEPRFDPISICCAVRLAIEEIVYNSLSSPEDQEKFIDTKETDKKLRFASEKGIEFPEVYNLLGVIYNDGLHLEVNQDKITPICHKLNNKIIRNMISMIQVPNAMRMAAPRPARAAT